MKLPTLLIKLEAFILINALCIICGKNAIKLFHVQAQIG